MDILADNRLILTFDSGLGGLTVYRHLRALLPDTPGLYLADDAAFPYGRLSERSVVARVCDVLAAAIGQVKPDVVVIACNTASTAVLPHLRAAHPDIDFIGTVPAVKPAAEKTKSGLISVLGTSGTVQRDYTRALIRDHAAHCDVTLVGSDTLAALAEHYTHDAAGCGAMFDDALVRELEPCFVEKNGARTDHIVLACTHYPLLLDRFNALAGKLVGWPVAFIDPAAAIANRAAYMLGNRALRRRPLLQPEQAIVWMTSGKADAASQKLFAEYGLRFSGDFSLSFHRD